MSKEKQIEEMAKANCDFCRSKTNCKLDTCDCAYEEAEHLYNAGYRKQSEGEWLEQVRVSKEGRPLLCHYKCNLCGVYLATQANYCPNCGAKMKGSDNERS